MKKPLEVESGRDAWEDLTTVADNTVYPENVLLASGIASANSLAFAGTLPASKNGKHDLSRVAASKGHYFVYLDTGTRVMLQSLSCIQCRIFVVICTKFLFCQIPFYMINGFRDETIFLLLPKELES